MLRREEAGEGVSPHLRLMSALKRTLGGSAFSFLLSIGGIWPDFSSHFPQSTDAIPITFLCALSFFLYIFFAAALPSSLHTCLLFLLLQPPFSIQSLVSFIQSFIFSFFNANVLFIHVST